ncbi:MAG: AAA family ATPase [Woeseiaceae bacterium]
MARALENPDTVPTYLDFFGMSLAPFARLAEPAQVFHAEQYSLLYTHLSEATKNADRLLVMCGADGSGKTTLLNRYIASLGRSVSFATFDETCGDATQFYCSLLRQLGFSDITGTLKELRHISREFLRHRGLAGDPVLVMVDNAQLVSAAILEQLRWLADITVDEKSVISLVLSGNTDLERIMASPAMKTLNFGAHSEFTIRSFTEQETDEYVRHRLRLAGGSESANLSTEARPMIHRFSGGNPSLINKLCDAVLSEGLAQETRLLDEVIVRKVAEDHKFIPHVVPLHARGRRKSDHKTVKMAPDPHIEERISARETPSQEDAKAFAADRGQTDVSIEKLLAQVSSLSEELDVSRTMTERALIDVGTRDGDISALLDKVAQQTKELELAERRGRESSEEIERLGNELTDSKKTTDELRKDLKAEKVTARKANTALSRATNRLDKLEQRKMDLQDSVRALKSEQKKSATEARRNAKAQDKKIADLEESIASLEKQPESKQGLSDTAEDLEALLAKKVAIIEELQEELDAYVEENTATQLRPAIDISSGTHMGFALPHDAYVGSISRIEVLRNGELDQVVSLEPGQKRVMIGRSDDSELCVKSKFVSRRHAMIYLSKEVAYIEDLRSYNGTIVNNKKVSRCDIQPDDTITIGDFELRPRQD